MQFDFVVSLQIENHKEAWQTNSPNYLYFFGTPIICFITLAG